MRSEKRDVGEMMSLSLSFFPRDNKGETLRPVMLPQRPFSTSMLCTNARERKGEKYFLQDGQSEEDALVDNSLQPRTDGDQKAKQNEKCITVAADGRKPLRKSASFCLEYAAKSKNLINFCEICKRK